MQIEFLGTSGPLTVPKPFCNCKVCIQAREKGIPYSRSGPSVFVHGPDVLIDTPEEIKDELNRSRVKKINACFYSHWHPDHVMGRRLWESKFNLRQWPLRIDRTDVYLPQRVGETFRDTLGTWDHLKYFEKMGLIRLVELSDGDTVQIGDTNIKPFRLAEDYVYAFLFENSGKRVLIAMDELLKWDPPAELHGLDLAVLPMGIIEFDLFNGERRIPENHPILKGEATFQQTLKVIRSLNASQVIIYHIEDEISYDDLKKAEIFLKDQGYGNITFAYDTMIVNV
ncbi:MAG: MBL fold metallo-hydrolase [Spirochaetota bacterium]